MTGADQPRELLFGAIGAASEVDVDVAQLTFIDSRVISTLTAAHRAAAEAGHRLVLVNPTGHVPRILTLTGVLPALAGRRGLIRPAVMGYCGLGR
jgi:anti-anti-sigma factor